MRAVRLLRHPALLLALVCSMTLATAVRAQDAPKCDITGPEVSCGPAEICGPEGNYDYYWARPFGGVEYTRCIIAVESGAYILWTTDKSTGIQSEPCFFKFTSGKGGDCVITGPDAICKGEKAELCGPEGALSYSWTGPSDFSSTDRCINVSEPGDYTLTVTFDAGCESTCKHSLELKKDCIVNCPHTIGFWMQQCAQKNDGSSKFTVPEVTQIASCVDDKVGIFNWGDDFAGFCATMNPGTINQRTQAKRQFAGMLANVCTGELGLIADNGQEISLDLDTPVTCDGVATTIGDLITSIDLQLQALEGQDITKQSVKNAYSKITGCVDPINNGIGIGLICGYDDPKKGLESLSGDGSSLDATLDAPDLGAIRAFPNPFASTVRLSYAVAPQGERVTLGVYDISGRLVNKLFDGFQAGGVHQTQWNATDAGGVRVRTGMYFIRGRVGERVVASRVMLVE